MTRSNFVRALTLSSLFVLVPLSLFSQGSKWMYLGEANLDGNADHDRISVGADKGQFRRIQFVVQNSAVLFDRILVHYSNGTSYPAQTAYRINAGGKTREIDLPGDRRSIESVEVWYRRAPGSNPGKPKIRLMGIRW